MIGVRPAREADRPAIAAVDAVAWDRSSTPSPLPLNVDWAGKVAVEDLTVAELDGRVVGYVLLSRHNRLDSGAHVGEVRGLAIRPEARGRGIGRKMLDYALQRAAEHGYRRVLLNVLATNTGARALYAAAGFRVVGVVREHFRVDGQWVDDLRLERVLVEEDREPEWLEGGCHCGAVRFRVLVRRWEVLDCNCSMCSKKAILHLISDDADFELVRGEESLSRYRFGTGVAEHQFCATCGIHPFYRPRSHPEGWSVNARCLDGDVLERFVRTPFDGRNWEASVDRIR